MSRAKLFWNLMAKRYSKSPIADMKSYEKTLNDTRKYLKKGKKVLEIGCGTGTTALKLASSVSKMDATDISNNMIDITQEKAKKQKVMHVKFFQSAIFDDKLKKNSYDAILAYNLLHLMKNTDTVMKRINELLKPGGLFIQKTPCLKENGWTQVIAFFLNPVIPLTCFTIAEFKQSMKTNGFEMVKTYQYPENPPRLFSVAKKVR